MGVRTTDAKNVALYDSVTGLAFGPVFKDEYEAEDFLLWLEYQFRHGRAAHHDPRMLNNGVLVEAVGEFSKDAHEWGEAESGLSLVEWLAAREVE